MEATFLEHLQAQTDELRESGLYKAERVIASQQDAVIRLEDGSEVINFCANNYLGLANDQRLIDAARDAVEEHGYGMASVRFICGTQTVHTELEERLSEFLATEATILYSSCWDANGGLFETVLGEEDAVISDALNHASIIDGIRLCKADRHRYANNDMADLEAKLRASSGARYRLIATDGVFSMDGIIANLPAICDLADEYDALVMVDDSHAVGFLGPHGGSRVRARRRRSSDQPRDARGCEGRRRDGEPSPRPRRVRHRILIPRRPPRGGEDPDPDVGCTLS